jgi:hypothetical protein
MKEQTVDVGYQESNKYIVDSIMEDGTQMLKLSKQWDKCGTATISKEQLNEIVQENAKHILSNRIVTLDISLTIGAYILSVFLIIFGFIISEGFTMFIGVCLIIPSIVHTVDGITRRWKIENIVKKLDLD